MRIQAPGSSWSGPARSLALSGVGAMLAACSHLPWWMTSEPAAASPADYLVAALASDEKGREQLWQVLQKESPGESQRLHRGLLRSIPGSPIYDPIGAEKELLDLIAENPSREVAQVARARLDDLKAIAACRTDVEDLKRRLSKVADIEKRQDRERH